MLFKKATKALAKPAGLLGAAFVVGATLLPAQPAPAAPAAPATNGPSCGLGSQDYPACPVGRDDQRIAQGFAIAPVGLNLLGRNPLQVAIGSYWVNSAGDCDGCHTSRLLGSGAEFAVGGDPRLAAFTGTTVINTAGYLAGGGNFGGEFARNLTPDWSTGKPLPAAIADEATFFKTLRTGHDFQNANAPIASPGNAATLQVMPWPALSGLTDGDLDAIWQYLSSIPCISGTVSSFNNSNTPPTVVQGQTGPVPHTCPAAGAIKYHSYKYVGGLALPTN